MSGDAERDPVEWAQHTALVAISVARTVLDLAEAAVTDRERLERLATSGRSFAETWLGDAVRVASTVASGFGFDTDVKAPAPSPAAPADQPIAKTTAARRPTVAKRSAKRATAPPPSKPVRKASKKAPKPRKSAPPKPKRRKT